MVLRLAKDLYGRSPGAHLLTVSGGSFETGESMSPAVLAAIPILMQQIRNFADGERDKEEK